MTIEDKLKEQIMENYKNSLDNLINASMCGYFEEATAIKKDILFRIEKLLDMV